MAYSQRNNRSTGKPVKPRHKDVDAAFMRLPQEVRAFLREAPVNYVRYFYGPDHPQANVKDWEPLRVRSRQPAPAPEPAPIEAAPSEAAPVADTAPAAPTPRPSATQKRDDLPPLLALMAVSAREANLPFST